MSKKSQKRRIQRDLQKEPTNILPLQKKTIRRSMRDYLLSGLLCLTLTVLSYIVSFTAEAGNHRNGILFFVVPLLSLITFLLLLAAFRRWRICRKIGGVLYSTADAVTIQCKKASALYHPVGQHSYAVICLVLRDELGRKYHYIYPAGHTPGDRAAKQLRHQLTGKELTLICYRDSSIVKEFPDILIENQFSRHTL